jgi:uncharacterized protein (UPF0335 family)
MSKKLKTYTVRRIVEELYQIEAFDKKDAMEKVAERGDPHTTKVIKETVNLSKNDQPNQTR